MVQHQAHHSLHATFSIICHFSHTLILQYLLIGEIAFKGMVKKNVSLWLFQGGKKGNSSCGQSYVSIDSTESGKMLSPHQDDKNWAKLNYISVKCEDSFKNQNGSHSMSVWAFTIILFSSWSSLEMMWAVTEWPD